MNLDEEDLEFLIENIESAQELIEAEDVDGLLEEIDAFMTERGYMPSAYDELNDLGRRAEQIYDRIYYQN